MLSIKDYAKVTGRHISTIYRQVEDKKLPTIEYKGNTYIVDKSLEAKGKLSTKDKKIIVGSKKEYWHSLIWKAHYNEGLKKETVEAILADVRALDAQGIKVSGYSLPRIYSKIKDPSALKRKTREDKFTYKNPILRKPSAIEKLKTLSFKFYDKAANGSVRQLTHLIKDYATRDIEFCEFAAVPFGTLYHAIQNEFMLHGMKEIHEWSNHYDRWFQKKPYIEGAFTKDVGFMDWLSLDDHQFEISGVLVYNELTRKYELKTVYSWFVIEMRTMQIVAYDIKVRDFNSNDIKKVLMQAIMNVGAPREGVLMDNGLAATENSVMMLNRLGIHSKKAKPYHPTDKANNERIFGFIKNECLSYIENYTGGSRDEGRHRSLKLSPEPANLTFEELNKIVDSYVYGFYQTRPRQRMIDGKKEEISIKDYFNREYTHYKPEKFNAVRLRDAFMNETVKKLDHNFIKLGKHGLYICETTLPLAFNRKKYLVKYNPLNMSQVDIYALEYTRCHNTGVVVDKGDFVATLTGLQPLGNSKKQELVNKVMKKHNKNIKKVAESTLEVAMIDASEQNLLSVNEKNKLVDERKSLRKDIESTLEDSSLRAAKTASDYVKPPKNESSTPPELPDVISADELDELDEIAKGIDDD